MSNGSELTGKSVSPPPALLLGSPTAHLVNRFPFAVNYSPGLSSQLLPNICVVKLGAYLILPPLFRPVKVMQNSV